MSHKNFCVAIVVLFLAISFSNCKTKTNNVAFDNPITFCKTVKALNEVVLTNNFPPMIASRNYAYACIAAYETMALKPGNNFKTLSGKLKDLNIKFNVPQPNNYNYELASLLAFVKIGEAVTFPEGSLNETKDELLLEAKAKKIDATTLKESQQLADTVAAMVLAWSKKDNYLQTRSAERYNLTSKEGTWQLTPPAYAVAVEPFWSKIRPMVMQANNQFTPPPPPTYNVQDKSSDYYKALQEVKTIGEKLNDEQKHIADFFDDNPFKLVVQGHVSFATKKFSPPGHWMNIVGIAAEKAKANFATTVAAYTLTSIAIFDGFISCWTEKYKSVLVRPETVVNKYIDPNWRPYIQTPPFPSYTSGHSVISAAAAECMTSFFGDKFAYTDTSLREFGITDRKFESFKAAADEASISRLYGGIHYRFDLDNGAKQGEAIGKYIVEQVKMK
jgi:hypothetical protein